MGLLSSSDDGYRYLNTDIKFSYAILRKDKRTRERYRIPRSMKALRLSKLQGHLKRRVNVVVAKMSGDLGGHGNHVYKVCDGTPQKPVFAVVPDHHASRGRALVDGRYGEILFLGNILVRSNPAHDAFNLFVDRFTTIEAVRGEERRSPGSQRREFPSRGEEEGFDGSADGDTRRTGPFEPAVSPTNRIHRTPQVQAGRSRILTLAAVSDAHDAGRLTTAALPASDLPMTRAIEPERTATKANAGKKPARSAITPETNGRRVIPR